MADAFSHPLTSTQSQSLAVLYQQAHAAQERASTYFQGVVDGIPIPEGVDYAFRLSEDSTTVLCTPKESTPDAPPGAE